MTPEERLLRDIFGAPAPHPEHPCTTSGCPGDGRYAPPGRGHLSGCAYPTDPGSSEPAASPTA